jgi:hypothetical protein
LADDESVATEKRGVYARGDIFISDMGQVKKVALSIHLYL